MTVIEMGNIANGIAFDITEEVAKAIDALNESEESGIVWVPMEAKVKVLEAIKQSIKTRLPETGYIVEATKEEIKGLPFNAFAFPVTISKEDVIAEIVAKSLDAWQHGQSHQDLTEQEEGNKSERER